MLCLYFPRITEQASDHKHLYQKCDYHDNAGDYRPEGDTLIVTLGDVAVTEFNVSPEPLVLLSFPQVLLDYV